MTHPSTTRPEAARRHLGPLGVILGYGPILPMVAAAILAWLAVTPWSALAVTLARLWGAAILAFVAGVRRGTSFYTPGGPAMAELAAALGFFAIAFGALLLPIGAAQLLLAVGYAAIALVDGRAAGEGYVPRYFAVLRPTQMLLAAAAFMAMAAA